MEKIKTPFGLVSRFMILGFGIPFTLIGIIIYVNLNQNWSLLFNGMLWLAIGFSLMGYDVFNKKKLIRLKESMVNSEGTDVKIIPALGIKIGSYVTARVECHIYSDGVYKTVKSGFFLLSPYDTVKKLKVKVYTNHLNKNQIAFEVYRLV